VVCTQYPNGNRLLASLHTPSYIVDYASQSLLDIVNSEECSVFIVDFNCVNPIINHDEKFSGIRYMRWGLRAQSVAVRSWYATGIENLGNCLLEPQP
jgi:hypothetical protein